MRVGLRPSLWNLRRKVTVCCPCCRHGCHAVPPFPGWSAYVLPVVPQYDRLLSVPCRSIPCPSGHTVCGSASVRAVIVPFCVLCLAVAVSVSPGSCPVSGGFIRDLVVFRREWLLIFMVWSVPWHDRRCIVAGVCVLSRVVMSANAVCPFVLVLFLCSVSACSIVLRLCVLCVAIRDAYIIWRLNTGIMSL